MSILVNILSEILGSDKVGDLIDALTARADAVLFDTPPLSAVTDAAILSKRMDGVLLVVESNKTKRPSLIRLRDDLARVGATIMGVTINKLSPSTAANYYYYYYYHDYYSSEGDDERNKRSRKGLLAFLSKAKAKFRQRSAGE